jgi:prolyl 4-hydroxylase
VPIYPPLRKQRQRDGLEDVQCRRVSSLAAYLNDVPGGGETTFSHAGLSVFPQRGNVVYFEYCNSRGQVDAESLHGGAPVTAGEKWAVTKWMRQRRFVSA